MPTSPWHDRGYLAYAALDSVMFLYGCALTVGLPLWILTRTTAPHGLAAAIFVVNTVIVVALQVRLARHGDSPRARRPRAAPGRPVVRAVRRQPPPPPSCTPAGPPPSPYVAAAVALTVVEMIQSAVTWELSVGLAPADAQGNYVGVHRLFQSVTRCLGPLLLTSVVIAAGPAGWLVLGAALAAAALLQKHLVLRRLRRPGPARRGTRVVSGPDYGE